MASAGLSSEGPKSLVQTLENNMLDEIKSSLEANARGATFACGGSVSFRSTAAIGKRALSADFQTSASEIDPIDIRFGENGKGMTLTLPSKDLGEKSLQELISACLPATFGVGGNEVFDEEYRKAGKLDRSAFATTFSPYEAGIVDVVAQLLLPQTSHDKHMRSIKAELYKLNVYSAPSGKFQSHVDTPRSPSQIGSLVVCLPVEHEGGELAVRNAGKETVFDWSASACNGNSEHAALSIKWAAFYSDCEHEVYEVISGHRVTLTYNLYAIRGVGHLAGASPALEPKQLPLYATLKQALELPGFLRGGRVLAAFLSHAYAHASDNANFLPSSLKGADMSVFETMRALGLQCRLVPVVISVNGEELTTGYFCQLNEGFQDNGGYLGPGPYDDDDDDEGWGSVMPERKITWLNDDPQQGNELQVARPTYGNEPGLDLHYSMAVMLVRIPPFLERGQPIDETKSIYDGIQEVVRMRRDVSSVYDAVDEEADEEVDAEVDEETNEGEHILL